MRQWIDNGNGRIKGEGSNDKVATALAVVGTGFNRKHSIPNRVENTSGYLDTKTLHVEIRDLNKPMPLPEQYFVGELARNESRDAERIFNKEEFEDYRVLVALATVSAAMNPHNIPLECLTVGLPLGLFQEKKNQMKEFVSKMNMEVTFISGGAGIPIGKPINVNPKEVKIFPQCTAGMFGLVFDSSGELKDPSMKGTRATVDIGWETTDIAAVDIEDGQMKMRGDMTETLNIGIHKAIEMTRLSLENEFGSAVNANEFEKALMADPADVFFNGKSYNLSDTWEHHKKSVATTIIAGIQRKWGNKVNSVRHTYLIGGGAEDFSQYLLPGFPTLHSVPEDPSGVNRRGFRTMDLVTMG